MAEVTDSSGSQPGYGIGALARRLGVAPATLRDWERRYGIGSGGRSAGGHRRYRPADIARIEHMRRLVLDGMPPGEAARAALASESAAEPAQGEPARGEPARGEPARGEPDRAAWGAGGRSLPLPGQLPQARGLARAALALDGPAIAGLLDRALDSSGVVATWERLAVPVLTAVGERTATSGTCIEVEHLLSTQLLAALAARVSRLAEPLNARTVLLACADDEEHSLPLYALAAALAERGVRTTMLGARTPPPALADAISRIGPAAAFVWSQTAATGGRLRAAARSAACLKPSSRHPRPSAWPDFWRGIPPARSRLARSPERPSCVIARTAPSASSSAPARARVAPCQRGSARSATRRP
jgi:DNA-binding transcriptional MerR regulator